MENIVFEVHDENSIRKFFAIDIFNDIAAFLTQDSLHIFMISEKRFKIFKMYKRNETELGENGDNSWVKIINKNHIAFGTGKGSIYLYNVNTEKCKPIHTGLVITDTFVYNNSIGVCVVGPKIILISETGDSIQSYTFDAPSPYVKNIISYGGNVAFACGSFLYDGKLQPSYEPKQIADSIMMIGKAENYIIAADFYGNISNYKNQQIEKVGSTELGVFTVFNTKNGSAFVDIMGNLHIANKTIPAKDLSSAIAYSYDPLNDRVIYIAGNTIKCISFKQILEKSETSQQSQKQEVIQQEKVSQSQTPQNTKDNKINIPNQKETNETIEKKEVNDQIKQQTSILEQNTKIENKIAEIVAPEKEKQEEPQAVALESVLDITKPFIELNQDDKCDFLLSAPEEQFLKALQDYPEEVLSVNGKEKIIECLIETSQWIRCAHLSTALDVSLNEVLPTYENLTKTELSHCISSISADVHGWKDTTTVLRLLANNFLMSGLMKWSLAAFIVIKDKSKVRVLVEDDSSLFFEALSYTRDNPNTEHSKFLMSLSIGF